MVRVHCLGSQGYAALLIRQAERLAAEGRCAVGTVVAPRETMTTVDPYARVAELRRAGWEVVEAFEELPTPGGARPAASGNEVGNAGTSADCDDLLLVPLPIHLHEEFVLKGLGAGFHVLCEKPAAGSVAAVQRMEEAAREHDRFLGFGFQHVLSGSMQRLLRLLRDNTYGAVTRAVGTLRWPRSVGYYTRNEWAGRLALNGTPILDSPGQNAGAHLLLNLLLAGGQGRPMIPEQVEAVHYRANEIEGPDLQYIAVRGSGGGRAHRSSPEVIFFGGHAVAESADPVMRVETEGATLFWEFPDTLRVVSADGPLDDVRSGLEGEALNALPLERAIDRIDGGEAPFVSASAALAHVAIMEASFNGVSAVPGVSDDVVHAVERNGTRQFVIDGADDLIERCARDGHSPLEDSVGWAREGLQVRTTVPEKTRRLIERCGMEYLA